MKRWVTKIKLNIRIVILLVTITLITVIFVTKTINKANQRHFKEMSQFETQSVANQMADLLFNQKTAVDTLSRNPQLKAWYLDEDNPKLAQAAHDVIEEYKQMMYTKTIFLTIDASYHYYMTSETDDSEKPLSPIGTLDRGISDDLWYFTLEEQEQIMMLNIDRDRYYNELRLWFNQKVIAEDTMIGVVGTGIRLNQVNDLLMQNQSNNFAHETRIINDYGIIQVSQDNNEIRENSFGESQLIESTIYKLSGLSAQKDTIETFIKSDEKCLVLSTKSPQNEYVFYKIRGTNLIVLNQYHNDSLYEGKVILIVVMLIIVLMLAFLMVYYCSMKHLYRKPLAKLINGIDKGNYEILEVAQRHDDWGKLAMSIQSMMMRLSSSNQKLIEDVEQRTQELKKAYVKIEANGLKLQELVNSIPIGIFMINNQHDLIYANPEFLRMYHYSDLGQLKHGIKNDLLSFFGSERDLKKYVEAIDALKETSKISLVSRNRSGETFWAEINLRLLEDNDYDWSIEGTVINIQSQKDYELDLYELATKDRLTEIYNRHYFDKMIREEIQRNDRYPLALSLIVFDLDHFKRVNDRWGHDKGDEVLKTVTKIVSEGIRTTDIFARWGGEEFVVLCPHTTQIQATNVAEKLRRQIEKTNMVNEIKVTSSFGVAERLRFEDYESWFRRADQALYAAKKSGRNQVSACEWITEDANHTTQLVWDEAFEFGIDKMDIAHQRIFYLSNRLFEKIRKKESAKEIFEQIIAESVSHFREEEEEMKQVGYERYLAHQTAHREILEKINKIYHRYLIQEIAVEEIYSFVSNEMMMDHILIEDGHFASYLSGDKSE